MYQRLIPVIVLLITMTFSAAAQGDNIWKTNPDDPDTEYNCETLDELLAVIDDSDSLVVDVLDLPYARISNNTLTVERWFAAALFVLAQGDSDTATFDNLIEVAEAACNQVPTGGTSTSGSSGSALFNVTATGNANMRSCAGTNCGIVAQITTGQLLKVVAIHDDWYEVEHEGSTAFIASWLTARAADNIISVDDPYLDPRTGCAVAFDIKRGDADMNLILSGERAKDIVADIYRPNEGVPLRVAGQLDKTFIDTGDLYVHQYYGWSIGWPVGMYNLELKLGGETSKVAFELTQRSDVYIHIYCD
jgi:uncharacterized protein YgiM (DUF1202 family)